MSPVLQLIAQRYRKGRAGKKADVSRDLIFAFPTLRRKLAASAARPGTMRFAKSKRWRSAKFSA